MNKKATTWRELRDFLNSAEDKQLDKSISWSGEEKGGAGEVVVLQEALYNDGEYLIEESEWPSDEELPESSEYEKGDFLFYVD